MLAVAHPWASASSYLSSQSLADSRCNLRATSRSPPSRRALPCRFFLCRVALLCLVLRRRRRLPIPPIPCSARGSCKERKKTDNPREEWEDGTPPPHRDFKERGVVRLNRACARVDRFNSFGSWRSKHRHFRAVATHGPLLHLRQRAPQREPFARAAKVAVHALADPHHRRRGARARGRASGRAARARALPPCSRWISFGRVG